MDIEEERGMFTVGELPECAQERERRFDGRPVMGSDLLATEENPVDSVMEALISNMR